MRTTRSVLRLSVLLTALAPLPAAAQFAVLYSWPGPFPCNGTLQACVEAAGPDDTVEIATNGPINESVQTTGSVDLVAAPGFAPLFGAGNSIGVSAIGAGDTFVRIQGLTLASGRIIVGNVGTGAQRVQILDNTILAFSVFSTITVSSSGTGQIVFRIEGNVLQPSPGADSAIRVFPQGGFGSGDIVDNVIAMPAGQNAAAIQLDVEDGALVVDVVGNRIGGVGYGYGIRHRLFDTTVLDSRVLGNLISGANAAGGAGVAVEGFTSDGVPDVRIVNNTLIDNATGVRVEGSDVEIVNNLLFVHTVGLDIASAGGSNRNNLLSSSDTDFVGVSAGPGTVLANPSFVGFHDYRLDPDSPGIDDGDSGAVPPEFSTDLAGEPRIQGAAVDIGAYEAPEPNGTSVAALAVLLAYAWRARSRAGAARR